MNYFAEEQTKALPEDMFILYNDYDTECGILPFKRKEILPDLAERFESGMPLIFNALVFMHRPMGYICYSFPDYEIIQSFCFALYERTEIEPMQSMLDRYCSLCSLNDKAN